jgi:hypothetical protein
MGGWHIVAVFSIFSEIFLTSVRDKEKSMLSDARERLLRRHRGRSPHPDYAYDARAPFTQAQGMFLWQKPAKASVTSTRLSQIHVFYVILPIRSG